MNIFHRVTLQSLKKNRTRTIVTIIGIILSAAMICAVTTTISSFRNYMLENRIYSDGDWHGRALNTDQQTYDKLRSAKEVASCVYARQLGYAYAQGSKNQYKPYLYLLGAGENFEKTMPIHITDGRFPQSSQEILLPLHLGANGGIRYKIGDTMTLDLGERLSNGVALGQNNPCYEYADNGSSVFVEEEIDVRESRTYTVVGFYERPSFEEYTAPGYTVITLAGDKDASNLLYDVYFKMQDPKAVFTYMEDNGLEVDTNTDVLLFYGAAYVDTFYSTLYSLAAIIMGLIMFGSISLIYNAFSISVSERTKQFGLLSSIGATKRQLRRMVLFEAFAVSLVGIPLGILVGIGGIGITLLLIGQKFSVIMGNPIAMRICVSPLAILTAIVVALVTVLISAWIPSKRATKISAIEAIRQSGDIKLKNKPVKTSKLVYKLFGLSGMLASKHYKRNRRKYRATVLSLFMSIVLFVSASAFTNYITLSAAGVFDDRGYDLRFDYEVADASIISKDDLLKQVEECAAVKDVVYTEGSYFEGNVEMSDLTDEVVERLKKASTKEDWENSPLLIETIINFVDDEEYKNLLKYCRLSEDDYMNPEAPLALAMDGVMNFNSDTQRYETVNYLKSDHTQVKVEGTKEIEGYYRYNTYSKEEDGPLYCQYVSLDNAQDHLELLQEECTNTYTLQVGKRIYHSPYFENRVNYTNPQALTLLYPLSLKDTVFPGMEKQGGQFSISSDHHTKSYTAIRKVLEDSGLRSEDLIDYAEQEENDRNMILIMRVFAYGFIVLISLIAAANVFNTISTNISLRRREFAMLKSVGMTGKGFNRMMNFECLLYGSKALLYGLPVSCFVSWLIYRAFSQGFGTEFQLPWSAIGVAVLSVFLVVFVTMMYSMTKIKKENPIDALKNENI